MSESQNLSDCKIILNIYYNPVQPLRTVIEENPSLYVSVIGGASENTFCTDHWCSSNLSKDNDGVDNISNLNNRYNELTSIYWYWKNRLEKDNPKYVGYNHYRRLFSIEEMGDHENFDIIVSHPFPMDYYTPPSQEPHHGDIELCYHVFHSPTDWYELALELTKRGENIFNWKRLPVMPAPYNMFLMKRALFEEYCEFIFPILDSLNPKIDTSKRDNYQKRALAFMSERIFSFWTYKMAFERQLKIKEVTTVFHPEWKDNYLNERGTF